MSIQYHNGEVINQSTILVIVLSSWSSPRMSPVGAQEKEQNHRNQGGRGVLTPTALRWTPLRLLRKSLTLRSNHHRRLFMLPEFPERLFVLCHVDLTS